MKRNLFKTCHLSEGLKKTKVTYFKKKYEFHKKEHQLTAFSVTRKVIATISVLRSKVVLFCCCSTSSKKLGNPAYPVRQLIFLASTLLNEINSEKAPRGYRRNFYWMTMKIWKLSLMMNFRCRKKIHWKWNKCLGRFGLLVEDC